MIISLHIMLALTSFLGFIARVVLSEIKPDTLKRNWLKISPHLVDTLLLISGIMLIFQGNWLSGEYGWLIAKMIALLGYIGFGIWVMRRRGYARWLPLTGSIACYFYIVAVAVIKNPFMVT